METLRNLMDPVREIIETFFPSVAQPLGYVADLPQSVEALMREAQVLISKRIDFETDKEEARRKRLRLSNPTQRNNWLDEAFLVEMAVDSIKLEFDLGTSYWARYKLGKRVAEQLQIVKDLNERGNFDRGVASSAPPRVFENPTASTRGQRTSDKTLEEIWGHLHDDNKGVICVYGMGGVGKTTLMKAINNNLIGTHVYGMGGVGKTTLMKAINNNLIGTHDFNVVIWIAVSKDLNLEKIQKEIMERLGLNLDDNESPNKRREKIYETLQRMKYLLILDDLWEEIKLDQVGIPAPKIHNRSKVVITTRFVGVGNSMEADEMIKVHTLTEAESWNLFLDKAGEAALVPGIQSLAEQVVKECDGLPLAITVVGRALRWKKKKQLWENALRALKGSAPDIAGMEPKVFLPLKLSYDHLEDDKIKICFLYCSLFPEDYEINIHELVRYWIMEGFIDNVDDLVDASYKGHDIVERIKDACLLEEGCKGEKHFVKMHDLIRDLALWITSSSNQGRKFMVRAGVGLKEPPQKEMWRDVERVSLMGNWINCLPFTPDCHNLVSLLLRENPICVIPSNFFTLMPTLQILDLSSTSIAALTVSSSLVKLRALILRRCENLREVPLLGQLKELQFLDLSYSGIRSLPQDMGNLVKLKKLNLSHMRELRTVPCRVLSRLSSMEDLRLLATSIRWATESELGEENGATLSEVANLTNLSILKTYIGDFDCVAQDVFCQLWLTLKRFTVSIGLLSTFEFRFSCAKQVLLYGCNYNAHWVRVLLAHAEGLMLRDTAEKHVSHLVGDSKSLRTVVIRDCQEMECVINWSEVEQDAPCNVDELYLLELPKLKKLFAGELLHRSLWKLKILDIRQCNKLVSLFSSEMVEYLDQLEVLYIGYCDELKDIVEGDESLPDNPFPRLRSLSLERLGELRSIIRCATLALPSLTHFSYHNCPKLLLPECPTMVNVREGEQLEALLWA